MDRSLPAGSRGGWFSAVTRCFWGKPKEDLTRYRAAEGDTIEFEDIITAENRASDAHTKKQMVTESERELLRSGKFDQLVEQQRRIDAERDAELRRQEERLRREEEAYYSAKREAAKRTTQVSLESDRQPQSQPDVVIHHQPRATPTSLPTTLLSSLPQLPPVSQLLSASQDEEEDFDQFLESVKARQHSITNKGTEPATTGGGVTVESGEEEEVDFGYWEKAELPEKETDSDTTAAPAVPPHEDSGKGSPPPQHKEMDLSLL